MPSSSPNRRNDTSAPPRFGRRLLVLGGLGAVMAGAVGERLVRWQVLEAGDLAATASVQQRNEQIIASRRGAILSRDGTAMALSRQVDRLIGSPNVIAEYDTEAVVVFLTSNLGLARPTVLEQIGDPSLTYTVIADDLEPEHSSAIRQAMRRGEIGGFRLEPITRRIYPGNYLGSHLIGFVDGFGAGHYGIESFYNEELSGRPGRVISDQDPRGRTIPVGKYDPLPPVNGSTLVLTMDRTIQRIAEQELEGGLARFGSSSGTIIVMDPRNGDVLGLANRPAFNASRLQDYAVINEDFINPAISLVYDPGSTFKIMTMAAGLDAGVIGPGTRHNLPGVYEYWGLEFSNWDEKTYPDQDMISVLANSSNIGAIFVADSLGADSFYDYVRAFGFGDTTGIDLASEVRGILKARGSLSWYPSDLAANSFGQSISTTPIQMAMAFGVIANGGLLMQPRAVGRVITAEGDVIEIESSEIRRVIRPSTSRTLIDMMYQAEHSVFPNLALSDRYSTVGKTGTAEISAHGGFLPEQTIASYIGFGPRENPQVLVSVKIDRPSTGTWGSRVASPIFRQVVDRVFAYLRIPAAA